MPKVFLNRAKDQAKKEIDNLKWDCRKNGFPQNICKAYKNHSLSAIQYLMIKARNDEIKAEKGG